jgi:hypothetical protein
VGKPEGRRPLGRPKRRWVDNIMTDLVEVGWGDLDWVGLTQDRKRWRALVNSIWNLRVIGGKARGKETTRKTKTLVIQQNLSKAESQGTEYIFQIGQFSALYKTVKKKLKIN